MTGDTVAFPRGKKKQEEEGSTAQIHTTSTPTNPNSGGSINSSGNNNPNKPWQRVGYLSQLLIDHPRLETSLLLASTVNTCTPLVYATLTVSLFLAHVCWIAGILILSSLPLAPETFIHRESALCLVWCPDIVAQQLFLYFYNTVPHSQLMQTCSRSMSDISLQPADLLWELINRHGRF